MSIDRIRFHHGDAAAGPAPDHGGAVRGATQGFRGCRATHPSREQVVGAAGPRHVADNADKAGRALHHVALSLAPSRAPPRPGGCGSFGVILCGSSVFPLLSIGSGPYRCRCTYSLEQWRRSRLRTDRSNVSIRP